MSSIELFNPDRLMLETGDLSITVRGIDRKINLIRPNADFLWLLRKSIDDALDSANPKEHPETAKIVQRSFYSICILLIAARERMLHDEDARWTEEFFEAWKPLTDSWLAAFRLFKEVATLAAALKANTPETLRNERKAWSQSILRVVEDETFNPENFSSTSYSKKLRKACKEISAAEGKPFEDDEPEMRDLIKWAKNLSVHDENDPNHLKSLRKQVRQALDRYRQSLLAEANFKRKDKRHTQMFVSDGKLYARGIKGHIYEVRLRNLSPFQGEPVVPHLNSP
jgi:hypothetical protein